MFGDSNFISYHCAVEGYDNFHNIQTDVCGTKLKPTFDSGKFANAHSHIATV